MALLDCMRIICRIMPIPSQKFDAAIATLRENISTLTDKNGSVPPANLALYNLSSALISLASALKEDSQNVFSALRDLEH